MWKVFIFQSEYSEFLCCFQSCVVPHKTMEPATDSAVHPFQGFEILITPNILEERRKNWNINTKHSLVTPSWLWLSVIITEEQRVPRISDRNVTIMEQITLHDRSHFMISSWSVGKCLLSTNQLHASLTINVNYGTCSQWASNLVSIWQYRIQVIG